MKAWATVTDVSPVTIQFDGDSVPLPYAPDSLVGVRIGDRVWCDIEGKRVVILGVGNPDASSEWTTFTKVSPSASMVNILLEYRITGRLIEWRTSGNTAAAFDVPPSGDAPNQNITTSVPGSIRPVSSNWAWVVSIGYPAFLAVTPGGNVTLFAAEGRGGTADYTVPSGTALAGQSSAFVLP